MATTPRFFPHELQPFQAHGGRRDAAFVPHGMRHRKQLRGTLSEVRNLVLQGRLQGDILNLVQIDGTVVRQVVEHVEGVFRGLSALFEPKDEVDPQVQVRADVLAFKRRAVLFDKVLCAALSPSIGG